MRRRPLSGRRPYTAAQVLALAPFAWWKAGDLALADGAAVASWADASGNGRTLTQATGTKQPTYVASGLNGLPSVRSSAANVSALATAAFTAFTQATVLVVTKAPTTTPVATQYLLGGTSNGTRRDLNYTTGRVFGVVGVDSISTKSYNGTVTTPAGLGAVLCSVYDSTGSVLYHDSIPTTGDAGNIGNTTINVFARNGQTASYDGEISEIIYFSRRLAPVEIMGVQRYLAKKYAVALTQPGVVFVDGDTGSDTANTGRSASSPLKTVTKAHAILGATDGRIEVVGTLREQLSITTTGKRLIKLNGATWYGSEQHTSGWTSVGGGIYSKAVTGYSTSLTNLRVVTDLDADGFWTTLTPNTATPTTPAAGEFGFSSSTIYVHLAGGANPNTKTIEAAKFDACIFSRTADEHVVRGYDDAKLLVANRACILIGSSGTDGRIITMDLEIGYGGDLGCEATQNDAVSYKRYRNQTYRAMNDGGNWHTTRTAGGTTVYSEDCEDHHNYDEGESAHDTIVHVVRGGHKHHNVTGGGITNVGTSTLDADGSTAGPLEIDHNHTASLNTKEGGVSIYETTTSGVIGPNVHSHDNNGPNIYFEPGATGTVDPAAIAASTGGASPDVLP